MKEVEPTPELEPTPIYDQLVAEQEQVTQQPEKRLNLAVVGPLARAALEAGEFDGLINGYRRKIANAANARDSYRPPLFPPRRVPSFVELAGQEAANEYYRVRKSQEDQVIARASKRRKQQP